MDDAGSTRGWCTHRAAAALFELSRLSARDCSDEQIDFIVQSLAIAISSRFSKINFVVAS
jgi:hypothetical protein